MPILWLTALTLAALGAWIGFAALPGINWPLWTAAATAGFALCGRASASTAAPAALTPGAALAAVLACFLSLGAAITSVPAFLGLIFLGVAGLAAWAVQAQASTHPSSAGALLIAPVAIGVRALREAGARATQGAVALRAGSALPVLRGVAIALPILVLLFLLLSNADPTLAGWRDALGEALESLSFLPRLMFFLVLLILMLGAYGLTLGGRYSAPAAAADGGGPHATFTLAYLERLIVLGSVATLFTLFFVLQLSYLFGDLAARPGSGVTFAEAVHRGFGELTVAAACCVALIVGLDAGAPAGAREPWIRLCGLVIVGQALLLLASAYQRVVAYEAAYGYTLERLLVQVYEAVIGLILLLTAAEIWRGIERARLLVRSVVTGVIALMLLIWANPHATVVHSNLVRYHASGKLDAQYLAQLARAPDAIPELVRSLPQLQAADAARIRAALAASLTQHQPYFGARAWYEWNLRRSQARAALLAAGLSPPPP